MAKAEWQRGQRTTSPVCPHCGHVERDAWEIDFGPGAEGDAVHTCGGCDEEYSIYRTVDVYYNTEKPTP